MLYGSETWSLGKNEIGILQITERAMVINICGVKLIDTKSTKGSNADVGLNNGSVGKTNSVRWYGHVLRKDENNFGDGH